jgi:hypothetical protein
MPNFVPAVQLVGRKRQPKLPGVPIGTLDFIETNNVDILILIFYVTQFVPLF